MQKPTQYCKAIILQLKINKFYWRIVDVQFHVISGVQQGESGMHVHISTPFLDSFPI